MMPTRPKYRKGVPIFLVRQSPDAVIVRFETCASVVDDVKLDENTGKYVYRIRGARYLGWVQERCVLESAQAARLAIQRYGQNVRETDADKPDDYEDKMDEIIRKAIFSGEFTG